MKRHPIRPDISTAEGRARSVEYLALEVAWVYDAVLDMGLSKARAKAVTRLGVHVAALVAMAISLPRSAWKVIRPGATPDKNDESETP